VVQFALGMRLLEPSATSATSRLDT
jgi:hypothetical protein